MTIEWANCTGELDEIPDLLAIEPHEDKPRRAWADKDKDVYHDGYLGKKYLLTYEYIAEWEIVYILSEFKESLVLGGSFRETR